MKVVPKNQSNDSGWIRSKSEKTSGKIFHGNETAFGYCTGNYGKSGYYIDEPMNGLDIKTVEEMRAFF